MVTSGKFVITSDDNPFVQKINRETLPPYQEIDVVAEAGGWFRSG
jgi:hypothetical protein